MPELPGHTGAGSTRLTPTGRFAGTVSLARWLACWPCDFIQPVNMRWRISMRLDTIATIWKVLARGAPPGQQDRERRSLPATRLDESMRKAIFCLLRLFRLAPCESPSPQPRIHD